MSERPKLSKREQIVKSKVVEITEVKVDYAAEALAMAPCTTVVVKTEPEQYNLVFRIYAVNENRVQEWQLIQLLDFAEVEKASELTGKNIEFYLNAWGDIVGYGKHGESEYVLYHDNRNRKLHTYVRQDD